jgi:hypothetical protein
VNDAWAKAVEIMGPGTITRDQAEAILRAGLARFSALNRGEPVATDIA